MRAAQTTTEGNHIRCTRNQNAVEAIVPFGHPIDTRLFPLCSRLTPQRCRGSQSNAGLINFKFETLCPASAFLCAGFFTRLPARAGARIHPLFPRRLRRSRALRRGRPLCLCHCSTCYLAARLFSLRSFVYSLHLVRLKHNLDAVVFLVLELFVAFGRFVQFHAVRDDK